MWGKYKSVRRLSSCARGERGVLREALQCPSPWPLLGAERHRRKHRSIKAAAAAARGRPPSSSSFPTASAPLLLDSSSHLLGGRCSLLRGRRGEEHQLQEGAVPTHALGLDKSNPRCRLSKQSNYQAPAASRPTARKRGRQHSPRALAVLSPALASCMYPSASKSDGGVVVCGSLSLSSPSRGKEARKAPRLRASFDVDGWRERKNTHTPAAFNCSDVCAGRSIDSTNRLIDSTD